MKKTFLALFLLICWYTTQAQFKLPSEEEASAVKGKTLLVVLPEGDGENDEYIKASNEWLKEIIAATWKFSTKVEYVSATAAESMMESTTGTYAVLDQGKSSRMERKSANDAIKHEVWEFRIKIQNETGKWKEAFTIPMLSPSLAYTDLQFIISQCQLYFE